MKIRTAEEAIGLLGGHLIMADLLEVDSRVVSNWIARGSFPGLHALVDRHRAAHHGP